MDTGSTSTSSSPCSSFTGADYFRDDSEEQQAPAASLTPEVSVQCETFICQGTDAAGDKCKRRLGPGSHNRGYCCITHHSNLRKCQQCDRSYVHDGCFVRVQNALVLSSVAHTWRCDACISGLSGTSTVKEESVTGESSAQKHGDEDTEQVSDPMLVFGNETELRKSARKNGWAVRSSQSQGSSFIRFCCGVQRQAGDSKSGSRCSHIRIAKRVYR